MPANRSNPDQFQLRLPPGLRERIKAYAERHGRSMNAEIVRILEARFPEPWTVESRVADLLGMIALLKEADAVEQMKTLTDALAETAQGIVTGRMEGVDDETRARILERLTDWRLAQNEDQRGDVNESMNDEGFPAFFTRDNTSKD